MSYNNIFSTLYLDDQVHQDDNTLTSMKTWASISNDIVILKSEENEKTIELNEIVSEDDDDEFISTDNEIKYLQSEELSVDILLAFRNFIENNCLQLGKKLQIEDYNHILFREK